MIETDSLGLTSGAAYAQTSQSFSASQDYGLNVSAVNTVEEDDIGQFTTTSSSFSGIVDINDQGQSLTPDQPLNGSYTVDSPATGRGEATTTNFISFIFYVVNSSTVVFVETDSNQVGTGTLELQSVATPGTAQARTAVVVHPAILAHAAFRHQVRNH